jgi:hypothetical protein
LDHEKSGNPGLPDWAKILHFNPLKKSCISVYIGDLLL